MDTSFSVIFAERGNLYKSKIGRIKNDIIGRFSLLGDKNFRGPGARLLPIDLMVSIEHRVKLKPGRRVLLVSVDGRLVRSCCSPARSSLEASLLPVGQHDPKRPHRSRAENFFENLLHRLLRHPRAGFLIVAIMRNVWRRSDGSQLIVASLGWSGGLWRKSRSRQCSRCSTVQVQLFKELKSDQRCRIGLFLPRVPLGSGETIIFILSVSDHTRQQYVFLQPKKPFYSALFD